MKKKQEDLSLWRRYMDGLYTTEDVSKMTETLRNEQPDNFLDEIRVKYQNQNVLDFYIVHLAINQVLIFH